MVKLDKSGRMTPYPIKLRFSSLSSSISDKKILYYHYLQNLKIIDTNSKQKLLA